MASAKNYFKDFDVEERIDEKGRRKKVLIYKGNTWTMQVPEETLRRRKIVFLVLALLMAGAGVAGNLQNVAGNRGGIAAAAGIISFIPMFLVLYSCIYSLILKTPVLQRAQYRETSLYLKIEKADFTVVLFEHLFKGDSTIGLGENDNWDINRMLDFVDNRVETSWNAYVGEHEQELYDLIDAAKVATDADRKEAYKKVMQFCVDHYVCTTVCNTMNFHAFRSDLTGIKYDAHCWPYFWQMEPKN